MNVFRKVFFAVIFVCTGIGCTKNGVNGDTSDTGIQLFNYYQSDKKYSLIQGTDTVISNIAAGDTSKIAKGSPGFYSLSVIDNTGHSLLTGNINLLASTQYSMFIIRDSAQNADSARYTLVTDDLNQRLPLFDSCRIRILNFARNIQYITLRVNINQGVGFGLPSSFFKANIIENRRYLDNNNNPQLAQYFTAPSIRYAFRFLDGNDTTKAILPDTAITFTKQKKYTILFLGEYNDTPGVKTADPFRHQIIEQ